MTGYLGAVGIRATLRPMERAAFFKEYGDKRLKGIIQSTSAAFGTAVVRKFSDGQRMNFAQRYRYNEMAQRYAVLSDLWRKKSRIREEGYRRPQDALLSVQGVRLALTSRV